MDTSTSAGGANQEIPGGESTDPKATQELKPNTVSHESFSKVLSEKKKLQERLEAFENEKKSALEKSGEFEALYREAQAKLAEEQASAREKDAKFIYSAVRSQFLTEAQKAGATRLEALEKLVDLKSLASEVDSNFQVKPDAMKSLIERAQKENDFLFKKEAAGFRDAPASNGKPAPEKSIAQMSLKEKLEALKKPKN